MKDFFKDPAFPNRPQHPDFWKLVDAINYLDGQATEGGASPPDIVKKYVDVDSVLYMCNQRTLRGASVVPEVMTDANLRSVCMALWIDGFALGCRYTKEKFDA